MPELVKCRPVPIDRGMKRRLRGHLYVIQTWRVERLATTDANISAAVADHPIGLLNRQHRIGQYRDGGQLVRQALTLVNIEHSEALEERNRPRLAIVAAGLLGLTLGRKPISVANHRPLLAAPNMPARRFGLPVGHPAGNARRCGH